MIVPVYIYLQAIGCCPVYTVQNLLHVSGVKQYGHQKTASMLQRIRIKAKVVLSTRRYLMPYTVDTIFMWPSTDDCVDIADW